MSKHNQDECLNPSTPPNINNDVTPNQCAGELPPSLKNVSAEMHPKPNQKVGYGHAVDCDPMQTGQIIENMMKEPVKSHDGTVIYRYSKAIRGADEAMKEMFSELVCIDEMGNAVPIPIIWGTQERAIAHVLQSNVKQDSSLVVHRIKLPILSIYNSGISFNQERYIYHQAIDYFRGLRPDKKPGLTTMENRHERDTVFGVARGIPIDITYQLTAWTLYVEDMNQIVEQVLLKFSPIAYIRVQGVHNWETIVKLDSIGNNLETEPGDQMRLVKFQFNMTVETFIPQPIVRKKAVLDQRIDIVSGLSEEQITEVLSRLENIVEDEK
jgi:hypothetical protein